MHREVVRIHSLESKIIRFIGEIGQMKRLTALFGDAQLLWVLPDNPDILDCLRASYDPNITAAGAEPVLTVRCGPRATALVMTDSSVSPNVLRNPVLRGALRTSWNERPHRGFVGTEHLSTTQRFTRRAHCYHDGR